MYRTPPKALAALSALSQSFAMPESFYVLGAGASVPHVPTTAQLSDLLSESFLAHGAYQTERIARDVEKWPRKSEQRYKWKLWV